MFLGRIGCYQVEAIVIATHAHPKKRMVIAMHSRRGEIENENTDGGLI